MTAILKHELSNYFHSLIDVSYNYLIESVHAIVLGEQE